MRAREEGVRGDCRPRAQDGRGPGLSTAATVPALLVTGGGDWGSYILRQVDRARRAGRLRVDEVVVADRDPACRAARDRPPGVRLEVAEWGAWLDRALDAWPGAHLVPWHFAPHLLLGVLERAMRGAGARVEVGFDLPPLGVPFEAQTGSGRAVSHATWRCPPTCIEPALCPHTRGSRHWDLVGDAAGWAAGAERVVFPCLHLCGGVGTVPLDLVRAVRDRWQARLGGGGGVDAVVATASHCHGLGARLRAVPG